MLSCWDCTVFIALRPVCCHGVPTWNSCWKWCVQAVKSKTKGSHLKSTHTMTTFYTCTPWPACTQRPLTRNLKQLTLATNVVVDTESLPWLARPGPAHSWESPPQVCGCGSRCVNPSANSSLIVIKYCYLNSLSIIHINLHYGYFTIHEFRFTVEHLLFIIFQFFVWGVQNHSLFALFAFHYSHYLFRSKIKSIIWIIASFRCCHCYSKSHKSYRCSKRKPLYKYTKQIVKIRLNQVSIQQNSGQNTYYGITNHERKLHRSKNNQYLFFRYAW